MKTLGSDGQFQPAPAQNQQNQQPAGFRFRLFVRIAAVITGVLAIILGIVSAITIYGLCIVAGSYIALLGFLVILLEAPFCCQFLDITDRFSKWSEARPAWQKALLYFTLPIVSLFFCPSVSQIFACVGIMATGVLYGLIFIGKKGDAVKTAHQVHAEKNVAGPQQPTQDPSSNNQVI